MTAWVLANPERRKEIARKSYLKLRPELKPLLTPAQRFEKLYVSDPLSGCWIWMGAVNKDGYGKVKVERKHLTAHRWSWILHRGEIPTGAHILHRCDVPGCVNPAHLFVGTVKDNVDDMWAKGRRGEMRGGSMPNEKNPHHKFTDKQIEEMRVAKRNGTRNKDLIKLYQISACHLSAVLNNRVRKISDV